MNRRWVWWVAGWAAVRAGLALAALAGLPEHGAYLGWYVPQGDELQYVESALALAQGHVIASVRPIGFPLLLVPYVWLTRAASPDALLWPVALFHGCLLGSAAVVLTAAIAYQLTRRPLVAILAAALWAVFPYLVYYGVHTRAGATPDVPLTRLAHQLWIQLASDPPSTIFVLATVLCWLIWWRRGGWLWALVAGAAAGMAVLVRLPNVVLFAVGAWWFGRQRAWRSFWAFGLAAGAFVSLQAAANSLTLGAPWRLSIWELEAMRSLEHSAKAGYPISSVALTNLPFITGELTAKLSIGTWWLAAGVVVLAVAGWCRLLRTARTMAWYCGWWLGSYLVVYGLHQDFAVSVLHFLMPVWPAVAMLCALALEPLMTCWQPVRQPL
ncbi:MAG: hypothetical protein HY597_05055 [Candidatus Omnitrophica bacterium]|nr:hypothetical protein [Candidatus Omnitrophota bacterium]